MNLVEDDIFLGDQTDAERVKYEDEFIIFTVANDSIYQSEIFNYPITDNDYESNYPLLIEAINDVALVRCTYPHKKILIQCSKGLSRSIAVMIGYMVRYKRYKFIDAKDRIKECLKMERLFVNNYLERSLMKIEGERITTGITYMETTLHLELQNKSQEEILDILIKLYDRNLYLDPKGFSKLNKIEFKK